MNSIDGIDEDLLSTSSPSPNPLDEEFRQGPHVFCPPSGTPWNAKVPAVSNKMNVYESHGEHDPTPWLSHKCHIIVFTYSGKPVYTKYGSEELIAGFTGTLQALVSKFASLGWTKSPDAVKSIGYGNTRITFAHKSPLILTCITKHGTVPTESIYRLLNGLHSQLIFILTSGINETLQVRPSFDVRSLLGGTKPLLNNTVSWMHRGMLLAIKDSAIEPLPLPPATRSTLTRLLQTDAPSCALLGLLLCGHRVLATWSSPDSQPLVSAADLVLLINQVISSPSLRSSESWTPVCLPSLSRDAFVYAYVQYVTDQLSYVCLSLSPDNANFHSIATHCELVRSSIHSDELSMVSQWYTRTPLRIDTMGDLHGSVEKQEALHRVRHCAIVLNQSRQMFSSKLLPGSPSARAHKEIYANYQQCMLLLGDGSPSTSQQVAITKGNDFIFVWLTGEFQFFLTAPRGIDISIITYVYQWIRDNEQTLFLSNIGSTGSSGTRINSKAPSLW